MAEKLLLDKDCKSARRKAGAYRLSDGGGLYLQVRPNGKKYWQFRYQYGGKERLLQIGPYPDTPLAKARQKLAEHKAVLRSGRDPVTARRVEKVKQVKAAAETFSAVATEWLEHNKDGWSAVHYERNNGLIDRILRPQIGLLPIREIDVTILLSALRKAERQGIIESARRARAIGAQIFTYAISSGRAESNPARDIAGAMKKKPDVQHFKALEIEQVGPMLNALEKSDISPITKEALLLMLYTGLRDHSLRGAKWQEIDFDKAILTVPASRMKRGEEHSVPLPRQAVEALRRLSQITNRGPDSFVFASHGKFGYLAENTLRLALHRIGFEVTAHGLRSLLMDALAGKFLIDAVQRQLAHAEKDKIRAAYLRTDFWDYRVKMMAYWCDWCDALKEGRELEPDNVVAMRAA